MVLRFPLVECVPVRPSASRDAVPSVHQRVRPVPLPPTGGTHSWTRWVQDADNPPEGPGRTQPGRTQSGSN